MQVTWGQEGEVSRTSFGTWQVPSTKSIDFGADFLGSSSSPTFYSSFDLGMIFPSLSLDYDIYLPGQL